MQDYNLTLREEFWKLSINKTNIEGNLYQKKGEFRFKETYNSNIENGDKYGKIVIYYKNLGNLSYQEGSNSRYIDIKTRYKINNIRLKYSKDKLEYEESGKLSLAHQINRNISFSEVIAYSTDKKMFGELSVKLYDFRITYSKDKDNEILSEKYFYYNFDKKLNLTLSNKNNFYTDESNQKIDFSKTYKKIRISLNYDTNTYLTKRLTYNLSSTQTLGYVNYQDYYEINYKYFSLKYNFGIRTHKKGEESGIISNYSYRKELKKYLRIEFNGDGIFTPSYRHGCNLVLFF